MRTITTFGDCDPAQYGGGVVIDRDDGQGPILIYCEGADHDVVNDEGKTITWLYWTGLDEPVSCFDLSDTDWQSICDCMGVDLDGWRELVTLSKAGDVPARVAIYEMYAGYHGWINIDCYPQTLTIEEAETHFEKIESECAVSAGVGS